MTRIEFLDTIYNLCIDYGGSVFSWVRSPKHNQRVGGHPNSRHLDGRACDGRCESREDRDALFAAAYRHGLHGYKKGHLNWHLQADRPRDSRD